MEPNGACAIEITIDDTTPLLYRRDGLSHNDYVSRDNCHAVSINDYAARDNCHAVLIHCAIAATVHMRCVTTRLDDYSKALS